MSEWKKVKLGDCCFIGDGAHASLKRQEKGILYITAKNLTSNGLDYSRVDYISEELYNKHFSEKNGAITRPIKNDIIFSIIGSLGDSYLVKDEKLGISSSVAIFRSKGDILPLYLFYYLKSEKIKSEIDSIKGGVAQGFMSLSKLGSLTIYLPTSLKLQQRIAETLSRYDSLIENYQKQIKLLEESAQRLYKEWFIDLRFPGHENTKIVDGVPEGWEKKRLGEIFTFVRGKSYTSKELSNNGILMINLKNIQAFGGYKRNAEKRFIGKYKDDQITYKGDLIMGVTDMTQERRLVGHVALVPDLKETATFSMDLIKIIPFKLPNVFLYCAMKYGGISTRISPLANGVNVLHLKPEAMLGIETIIPSRELVSVFTSYAEKTIDKILALQSQIHHLTEARDRLLPKLMNGEIEV